MTQYSRSWRSGDDEISTEGPPGVKDSQSNRLHTQSTEAIAGLRRGQCALRSGEERKAEAGSCSLRRPDSDDARQCWSLRPTTGQYGS